MQQPMPVFQKLVIQNMTSRQAQLSCQLSKAEFCLLDVSVALITLQLEEMPYDIALFLTTAGVVTIRFSLRQSVLAAALQVQSALCQQHVVPFCRRCAGGTSRLRARLGAERYELGRKAAQSPHAHHVHLCARLLLCQAVHAHLVSIRHLRMLHSARQMLRSR